MNYYWDSLSEAQKQHLDYLLRGMALMLAATTAPPAESPPPPRVRPPALAPQYRVWKRSETAPACQHYFDANKTAILSGELSAPAIHRVLSNEMGIPSGTVSAQLSKWRRAHGIIIRANANQPKKDK